MTREMLEELVRDCDRDEDVDAHWERDEVVVTDVSDEAWIDNALVKVPRAEADRPSQRIKPNRHGLYEIASFTSVGITGWGFNEIVPPWPAGALDARTILDLMSAPSPDKRPIGNRITARAHIDELAAALQLTTDTSLRKRICYAIQKREPGDSSRALPVLLPLLKDPDAGIRTEAADAIFAIAHCETAQAVLAIAPDAGEALLTALTCEDRPYARELMADALGELHHRPAIPDLIEMLQDDSERIRRVAAWALGEMQAAEAEPALRNALRSEDDQLACDRMREALSSIGALGSSS